MTASHSLRQFSLAPHVRACACDGQVILLDLLHNRYLGVSAETATALAVQVNGWPVGPAVSELPISQDDQRIQRLLSQGLLTHESRGMRSEATLEIPTQSIDLDDIEVCRSIEAQAVLNFMKSAAIAAWWMRFRTLNSIVHIVTERRRRLATPHSESLHAMKSRAVVYDRLRPLVFSARERCLHDSLTLTCFLASDKLLPRWVVGVKTGPFGAHSWVQCGCTVLNDQHDYIRRFQPILVV